MKVKILKIEPYSEQGDQEIVAEIGGQKITLFDPSGLITEDHLKKTLEIKICAVEGKVEETREKEGIDGRDIVARVVEKEIDYVVLDCRLFKFDYLINQGDEEKFEINKKIKIKKPRLDLVI